MTICTHLLRAGLSAALGVMIAAPLVGQGLEPKPLPPADPLKARSAEENVVSGQIYDDKDKRLDVRDRVDQAPRLAPPPAAGIVYPEDLPEYGPPAVVDVTPVPEVAVGLEVRTGEAGLLVIRVQDPSPAHEAGFKYNDLIKRIADRAALTPKDLHETLNRFPPLAQVPFDVERGSDKLQLILTLPGDHVARARPPAWGTAPPNKLVKSNEPRPVYRDPWLGWVVSSVGTSFVQVMAVQPGTAANAAGLQSRDIVLTADGVAVYDPETLIELVHRHVGGDQIPLVVRRNGTDANTIIVMPIGSGQPQAAPVNTPVNPAVTDPAVTDPAGPVAPGYAPAPNVPLAR